MENIVAIGTGDGPGTLDCGIKLAEKYPFIYATIGIHPHEAKLATDRGFPGVREFGKAAEGNRMGRDRARLFLRSLSTRNPATGILAPDRTGQSGHAADRDSLPAFAKQRERLGRLLAFAAGTLGGERVGGCPSLFYWNLGASQAGSGHGFYDFFCREPHFSQGPADSGGSQRSPA